MAKKQATKRNVMRAFKISEISSVDKPAQAGARAVLMKRDDEHDENEEFLKLHRRAALTTAVDGHTHLVPLEDYDGLPVKSGVTSYNADHDHPFVVQEDGTIVLGESRGHTHEVGAVSKIQQSTEEDDEMTKGTQTGGGDKAPETLEQATAQIADLNKKLGEQAEKAERLEALASLSADERAHYEKLGDEDKAAFLKLGEAERKKTVEKAAGEDPVVYTAGDGTEYRKSDDPRVIALAKQADENGREARKQREELEAERLEKRAEAELPNLPGDTKVRAAVIKAIDGIEDEEVRKKAHESVTAGDKAMKAALHPRGHGGGGGVRKDDTDSDDPSAQLEKRAEELAKEENIPHHEAYEKVLNTEEGQRLYAESVGEATH